MICPSNEINHKQMTHLVVKTDKIINVQFHVTVTVEKHMMPQNK